MNNFCLITYSHTPSLPPSLTFLSTPSLPAFLQKFPSPSFLPPAVVNKQASAADRAYITYTTFSTTNWHRNTKHGHRYSHCWMLSGWRGMKAFEIMKFLVLCWGEWKPLVNNEISGAITVRLRAFSKPRNNEISGTIAIRLRGVRA